MRYWAGPISHICSMERADFGASLPRSLDKPEIVLRFLRIIEFSRASIRGSQVYPTMGVLDNPL